MISIGLFVVLIVCVIVMCVMMAIQAKWYGIKIIKVIPIAISLVLTGVIGSEIWFFVENGTWGGRSFYGAIVFSPLVFIAVAILFKINYSYSLDFVAPSGCLALALIKIQCIKDNCCYGKVLYQDEDFIYVRFPSQIVEMIAFLMIFAVLFYMASKIRFRGKIFPWFLILYGGSRFFLDFLRETIPSYLFGLSAGSFWSLCSVIIGVVLLILMRYREKTKNISAKKNI